MKKLSKKISFLFIPILLVTFIYSSCNDSNETVSDLEIDTQKIEKLLSLSEVQKKEEMEGVQLVIESNFSKINMVNQYLRLYESL